MAFVQYALRRMYKIEHGPVTIICDSQAEFEHAMDYIRKELAVQPKGQVPRALAKAIENVTGFQGLVDRNPWSHRVFFDFITAVGDSQRTVLALLVQQTRATDSQLREAVGVNTNQQLAGVLSGVSKQAAAFDLPARAVFTIENESKSGATTKTYVISKHFLATASTNNWPLDETGSIEPSDSD